MENVAAPERPRRDLSIDLLKTVAIFCVIVIHACKYTDPIGSFDWTGAVLWGSLVRPAEPIFFMCSGALMLRPEKDLPLKKLFLHNLLRLVVSMVVWAMLYKLWYLIPARAVSPASLWRALKDVLLFRQEFHFYYIHITLLVYLFLPVTRVFVRAASKRQLQYALAFWFAFGILYPTLLPYWPLRLLDGFPLQYRMNMTYAAIGYGLLGWYLRAYPLPRRAGAALWLGGFLLVLGGTYIGSLRRGTLYELFFEGMGVGVCAMAAGLFSLAGGFAGRLRRGRLVSFVSRGSFCVYLSHMFFLYGFANFGFTVAVLPKLVSVPLVAGAALLCSLAVYGVLSGIPVVNRWLI